MRIHPHFPWQTVNMDAFLALEAKVGEPSTATSFSAGCSSKTASIPLSCSEAGTQQLWKEFLSKQQGQRSGCESQCGGSESQCSPALRGGCGGDCAGCTKKCDGSKPDFLNVGQTPLTEIEDVF